MVLKIPSLKYFHYKTKINFKKANELGIEFKNPKQ